MARIARSWRTTPRSRISRALRRASPRDSPLRFPMDILLCGWDTKPVHHIRGMSLSSTAPGVTRSAGIGRRDTGFLPVGPLWVAVHPRRHQVADHEEAHDLPGRTGSTYHRE